MQQPSFIEEMMAAGRGVLGLILGNKQAGSYFNFTQRGLAGSFIALLLISTLNASMPTIMGTPGDSITQALIMVAILFCVQVGFGALALRQMKRLDGFMPFLVADNWANFFLTLISTAVVAAGLSSTFTLLVMGVIVIIVQVNVARIIVTLAPLQIAIFLIAQMVGVFVGLMVAVLLFPVPAGALPSLQ